MADISPSTSTDGDTDDKNLRVISKALVFSYFYVPWLNNFSSKFQFAVCPVFSTSDMKFFPSFMMYFYGNSDVRLIFVIVDIMYAVSK